MFRGTIFDLDGVVVQSELIHYQAWKKAFVEIGINLTLDDYFEKVDGKDRMTGARSILESANIDVIKKLCRRKQHYFLEILKDGDIKPYLDAISFITFLKKENILVGLISSSKNAPFILQKTRIEHLFNSIVISDHTIKSKPHPDIFLVACRKMVLTPKKVVVFEDSVAGIIAAKNAGMFCIGVKKFPQKNLKEADIIIENFENISIEKKLYNLVLKFSSK